MSVLPVAVAAEDPKTANTKTIALFYAVVLVVFAVAQLFSFEDFRMLIQSMWLPGGTQASYLLAAGIVTAEVFALPFLLRMKVSPLMRMLSMVLGWFVSAFWLTISLWLMFTTNAVTNVGFLGTVAKLPPGWWAVLLSAALGILAAWASWGMWPRLKHGVK